MRYKVFIQLSRFNLPKSIGQKLWTSSRDSCLFSEQKTPKIVTMQQHFYLFTQVLLSASLISIPVGAALPTEAGSSLSFYRSKESSFPSGQATRSDLEKQIVRSEKQSALLVEWNQKTYSLKEEDIFEEIDLAKFVEAKSSLQIYKFPDFAAESKDTLSAKESVTIKDILGPWALIESSQKSGWVLKRHLKIKNEDAGLFLNLIPTALRVEPRQEGRALAVISLGQRLSPLEFKNSFVKVRYQNIEGWVDMWHLLGRMDFAKFAYHSKSKWVEISHRLNDQIITKNTTTLPVSEIKGWYSSEDRVLMRSPSTQSPPLRAQLRILERQQHEWVLSKVEKHGEVWWKREQNTKKSPASPKKILTSDLLNKELYSIAFNSKESLAGLVSSQGVWRSTDGENWEPIERFEKSNLPVAIWPGGAWYVGSYKSLDKGKSFEPFIRWEKLTETIQSALGRPPSYIKITQLQPTASDVIEITVETGLQTLKLKSNTFFNDWKIIR